MAKPTVLFIEPDEVQRMLINQELEEHYQLVLTATVKEGQDLYELYTPDVVVVDYKLSADNGSLDDFLLRTEKDNTKVIIMNSCPDHFHFDYYLEKTSHLMEDLYKGVADLLHASSL